VIFEVPLYQGSIPEKPLRNYIVCSPKVFSEKSEYFKKTNKTIAIEPACNDDRWYYINRLGQLRIMFLELDGIWIFTNWPRMHRIR
jgi:hypothetical protein